MSAIDFLFRIAKQMLVSDMKNKRSVRIFLRFGDKGSYRMLRIVSKNLKKKKREERD